MKELLRSTTAYRTLRTEQDAQHALLVVFPDAQYLRPLLRECAKAFFKAEDGSREEKLIEAESFSDCLFFPAPDAKLTVEDGARIVDESLLRPLEGNRKLFVLDAFHNASPLVQNKLLKILEEPPEGVNFLIGATSEFPVLPTVLSRVGKIAESPFSEEAVAAALGRKYPREGGVAEAAAACGGVFSTAEELLSGGGEDFRLAEEFLLGDDPVRFIRAMGERKEKRAFFAAVRLLLRDMLFYRTGQEQYAARSGNNVQKLAFSYPAGAIVAASELVTEAEKQIAFNANFGQCAEALAIGIAEEKLKWQRLS